MSAKQWRPQKNPRLVSTKISVSWGKTRHFWNFSTFFWKKSEKSCERIQKNQKKIENPGNFVPKQIYSSIHGWTTQTSSISVQAHLRWHLKSLCQQSEHSFPWGKSDYFQQPLPPIQCWREMLHRSMQWPNFRTSDHVGINFQNSRNFPTLEKSHSCLQHWIGGKGLENKYSSREKHTFRPSSLKNKKTRMRARDFGTP